MKFIYLLMLFSSFAFADDFSNRVHAYYTQQAEIQAQKVDNKAISDTISINEWFMNRVLTFARQKRASVSQLNCYDIEATYSQKHGGSTLIWRSRRGFDVPVLVEGSSYLFYGNQRSAYPPRIDSCHFDLNTLACSIDPVEVRCVNGNGAPVIERKY